jgi:hypothetical protein
MGKERVTPAFFLRSHNDDCQSALVHDLSWFWIALMLTVPPVAGVMVAFALWRSGQMILGNIAGTIVIFATAIALILREFVELDRLTQVCLDAGVVCFHGA